MLTSFPDRTLCQGRLILLFLLGCVRACGLSGERTPSMQYLLSYPCRSDICDHRVNAGFQAKSVLTGVRLRFVLFIFLWFREDFFWSCLSAPTAHKKRVASFLDLHWTQNDPPWARLAMLVLSVHGRLSTRKRRLNRGPIPAITPADSVALLHRLSAQRPFSLMGLIAKQTHRNLCLSAGHFNIRFHHIFLT